MSDPVSQLRRPRCLVVYATAPENMAPVLANRIFNAFVADTAMPLAVFHDHFIGRPGGIAIFFTETSEQRKALLHQSHLQDWQVDMSPLVFSYSPAAFDEQIAFTLSAYRGLDWEQLQRDRRPRYGRASREAETAQEDVEED